MRTNKALPVGQDEQMSFNAYKKNAKRVIKDFCLSVEDTKRLQKKVDIATTLNQVDDVLREARKLL